ncbi:MAG: hypothetical protein ACLU8F_03010 [Clostridia bacterium]
MKVFAVLFAVCFSIASISPICAKEASSISDGISINGKDATILYEDKNVAVVEVEIPDSNEIMPRGSGYSSVWLESSKGGSFTVSTPYSGTLGFTFKVESSSNSSWATFTPCYPSGGYVFETQTVSANKPDLYKTVPNCPSGTYTIKYNAHADAGMRLMCWIYKV